MKFLLLYLKEVLILHEFHILFFSINPVLPSTGLKSSPPAPADRPIAPFFPIVFD